MASNPDFPDDENGQVLQRMLECGNNLTLPRMMDFEHVFPDEAAARAFAEEVRKTLVEVVVREDENTGAFEVQCRQRMVPTHAAISSTEATLAEAAQRFGGQADGWGSLSNPDGTPAE